MDTASDFSRLLGPLRRAVLRSTRGAAGLPDLPEAQIELLRALAAEGSLGARVVADRLRIAPSTVSNLVKTMVASGLVERAADRADQRAVVLTPTPAALDLLDRYDRASTAALEGALAALPAADRDTLRDALPVLRRLVRELDNR
ncbi:MarR family winged helix-turn-helix transcriptional regulator [Streptomyces sp. NPDC006711]|uniref:MarR family winged helix-turn-helix transcriptional regulator n=1 Tax=unclassified Streptomyces TaxID=2593676 RepID=UPI0036A65DA0